jgi:hypothetical protein
LKIIFKKKYEDDIKAAKLKPILKSNKAKNFPDEILDQDSDEKYFSKHYIPPKVCVLIYIKYVP